MLRTVITAGFIAMALASTSIAPALAVEGVINAPSSHSVSDTVARLESAAKAKEFVVFATVDHAAGATKVGMSLRPTTLVIFGNPRGGTPLMVASQSAGLDLPLKMLVWQDDAGKTWLSYNDPAWVAKRHGVDAALPAVAAMTTGLAALAAAAGNP